jgi:hypothetical protein
MKIVLDLATFLGGLAAAWFFWQQLSTFRKDREAKNRFGEKSVQREPRVVERHKHRRLPEPLSRASVVNGSRLRQDLLEDIYNPDLRARYVESRNQILEEQDRQRVAKTRVVFGLAVGLITWAVLFFLLRITERLLSGVEVELSNFISWGIAGATSGIVYGMIYDALQFPARYEQKEILKKIADFRLGAVIWAGGVWCPRLHNWNIRGRRLAQCRGWEIDPSNNLVSSLCFWGNTKFRTKGLSLPIRRQ